MKATDMGRWEDADLADTVRENAGIGADSDLPKEVRFIGGVAKLIRRRLARKIRGDLSRPCVFLLEPLPRTQGLEAVPRRVPMLDNGLTPVTGYLWFVSPAVINGYGVVLEEFDDEGLFRFVTDTIACGHAPAVIFDSRASAKEIRYYPSGLQAPEEYQAVVVIGSDVSVERIFEAVTRVYHNCMVTPDAQPLSDRLWKNPRKWYACDDAETKIQGSLKAGLAGAFPTCVVRHEQPTIVGRLDLEIEESEPLERGKTTKHAVLELKVLRSFRSSGARVSETYTQKWVRAGVRQAAAYRSDKNAVAAALCCFDMRRHDTGEKCFECVTKLAKRIHVKLRRWFLFSSSELFRAAVYPKD
jgi:hypothetical protein